MMNQINEYQNQAFQKARNSNIGSIGTNAEHLTNGKNTSLSTSQT